MYQPMYEQKALPAPKEKQGVYTVGHLESMSASALYLADKIYDFEKFQFSMHEKDDKITGAKIKLKGESRSSESEIKLDGYQAAMGDAYAKNLGKPNIKDGSG